MMFSLSNRSEKLIVSLLLIGALAVCGAGCQQISTTAQPSSPAASAAPASEEPSADSEPASEQESAPDSSAPESSDESSTESSEESSEESSDTEGSESEAESSEEEGYHFDDEQIVENYHTAVTFTGNDEFNALFTDNRLDKAYQQELQEAGTNQEMRSITSSYAFTWKNMVNAVYEALSTRLEWMTDEQTALKESQDTWAQGLGDVERKFYDEAQEGGTEALLEADTAMMNYYKGRTAILLEQIYELNDGEIVLSEYNL